MDNRIALIREKLKRDNLDGLLVTKEQNVSYLSGFSGSESRLFLTPDKEKFFLTDFRYIVQAKKELKDFRIIQTKDSSLKEISVLCDELNIRRLAFESGSLSYEGYRRLKKLIKKVRLIPTIDLVEELRKVKTQEELILIKKAVGVTVSCLDFIRGNLRSGLSEKEFAAKIDYFIRNNGGDDVAFKTIVASGTNSIMPHSIATKRVIKKDDSILIDFGVKLSGYNTDLTRIFSLGRINPRYKKIYNILRDAQKLAVEQIRPGIRICDIELRVRAFLKTKGLERFFGHSVGHGIGLEVHEPPKISKDNKDFLRENMVFTIEPGVYIPNEAGFRREDMVVVTKTGCEVLTDDFNR